MEKKPKMEKEIMDNYESIINRINQIRDLFTFGEGIMPFLEELFVFLREATPMLNEVSRQVMAASGAMPDATDRLNSAVEETSDATYTIMRSAEDIHSAVGNVEMMLQMMGEVDDETMEQLKEVKSRADVILNALQFHDIVTQRLIEVQKVLTDLQVKMIQLFTRVYELDIDESVRSNILTTMGVNPSELKRILDTKIAAESSTMTAKVDFEEKEREYKESKGPKKLPENDFSQDDIDALFS